MKQYISKDALLAEIDNWIEFFTNKKNEEGISQIAKLSFVSRITELQGIKDFIDTLEVKEVDLIDRKTDWSPSKKQLESLKDLLHYNIGMFDYQKFMEVNSLYEDLIKLLDYETNRQK